MNMKKVLALLLALAMVFSMAACTKDSGNNDGGSGDGSASGEASAYSQGIGDNGYFEGVTAKDYVTLGQYEGIEVPASEVAVSQEEIESEIKTLLSSHVETKEVSGRAAQLGDVVNIDYEGYMDGEQFEGGTGNNPSLELGSGSFIDGFEDGIVGHETGDQFDLDLHFPDPYPNNTDLSGKAVTFKVTLNSISEEVEPPLTDAFVTMYLQEEKGWKTVAEMRSGIEEQLKDDKLADYVLTQVDNFEVSDVPESMVQYEAGCMRVYYEQFAAMYGMTLDDFVSGMGVSSFDELVEQYREDLTASARSYLIYQAIAEDKGMTVTDEDVTAEFADMDESSMKDLQDYYGMPYIKCMLLNSKVAQLIRDTAVVK